VVHGAASWQNPSSLKKKSITSLDLITNADMDPNQIIPVVTLNLNVKKRIENNGRYYDYENKLIMATETHEVYLINGQPKKRGDHMIRSGALVFARDGIQELEFKFIGIIERCSTVRSSPMDIPNVYGIRVRRIDIAEPDDHPIDESPLPSGYYIHRAMVKYLGYRGDFTPRQSSLFGIDADDVIAF
jgi:hypothetical protein